MNRSKLLSIMPYILGILILILVLVIILTGMNDDSNSTVPTPTPGNVENKDDKQTTDKKTDDKKKDDKKNDVTDVPAQDEVKNNDVTEEPEPTATSEPEPTAAPTPTTAPTPTPVSDLTYGFKFESKADYVDTKDGVNLRLGCSTDTAKVAFLEDGKRLERTGYNDEWTRVIYDGQECYIATRLIIRAVDSFDTVVTPEPEASNTDNDGTMENANGGSIVFDKVSFYGAGAGKTVCIDPGHQSQGNNDTEPIGPGATEMKAKCSSGAAGVSTGTNEYELNLAVSMLLKEELEKRGYKVIMTRTTNDVNLSNAERAEIANDADADAFVRIHADSQTNSAVNGLTNYNMTPENPYNSALYTKSRKLSECINEYAVKRTGANMRGVENSDKYAGINWSAVPVTIVEMGFLSNPEEDKLMNTAEYRQKMAIGIADGLDKYFSGK